MGWDFVREPPAGTDRVTKDKLEHEGGALSRGGSESNTSYIRAKTTASPASVSYSSLHAAPSATTTRNVQVGHVVVPPTSTKSMPDGASTDVSAAVPSSASGCGTTLDYLERMRAAYEAKNGEQMPASMARTTLLKLFALEVSVPASESE